MIPSGAASAGQCPVALEINISHRYKAGEMGVFEFRVYNTGARPIQALELALECPCQTSRHKSAMVKNIAPSVDKRPFFQFEPARGGEALLEIELTVEDEVYRGQASVSISSENERSTSPTSFNINIHDIQKLMGNDLSGLLTIAGKELNEDRLRERMERKEPFWMRVDLDPDEAETLRRRSARREVICVPAAPQPPRTRRALLESADPSIPKRLFLHSTPEIRFGRNTQKNDVVLRFLPDFYNDERSKTISGEQFVVRYRQGECMLTAAPQGHASMSWDGRAVDRGEQIQLASGSDLTIGTHEFTLKVSCTATASDPHWARTREEITRVDPADDPFRDCHWDMITFSRRSNGEEEAYLWLFRKLELAWGLDLAAGVQAGTGGNPRARISSWNGRFYLEALDPEAQVRAGGTVLEAGQIACLGAETDISFGPLPFRWKLIC